MNASNQAMLSALMGVIGVIGALVVAMGWSDNAKVQAVLKVLNESVPVLGGAFMILGPLVWTIVDKFRARNKIAEAVNAGIAKSNQEPGVTPPVPKEAVPEIIKQFGEKSP